MSILSHSHVGFPWTSLKFGVPRNSTKWQETTLHRIQPQERRDNIRVYNRHDYLRFQRNYVKVHRFNTAV